MGRILVAEDHATTRNAIALYLERDGFAVETVDNGLDALALARRSDIDLLVLDLMRPGLDGREVCRRLRAECNLPIIMLTALSTEDDVIAGLGLGADDYMTKPFSPRELLARVKARLRPDASEAITIAGELAIDCGARQVSVRGRPVKLTPSEYRVLEVLVRAPGRAFTREEIIERAFGYDYGGSAKNVDIHISNLRKRLRTDGVGSPLIETVARHGYRFRKTAASSE